MNKPQKTPITLEQQVEEYKKIIAAEKGKRLLTARGFNDRYEEHTRINPGLKAEAVYELTEKDHVQVAARRKYSNFDSFRQIRKRIIRGEYKGD